MFAHLSLSAVWSVYVCMRHRMGPIPAPPPASRTLCGYPLPPAPGSAASLLEKHRGAEPGTGHPLVGTRSWDPPRDRYSPAPRKGDRKSRAARAFRQSSPLASVQLAAGGKGRGPARPLTHPERAGQEGPGPAGGGSGVGGGNPFRGIRGKGGRKVKTGEQLSK